MGVLRGICGFLDKGVCAILGCNICKYSSYFVGVVGISRYFLS